MSFLIHHMNEPAGDGGPRIGAMDRGLQLGDGVFDTLVARGGMPMAPERHRQRLLRAAEAIGLAVDRDGLEAAMAGVLAELAGRDAIIRTTLTRGQGARGLWPAEPPRPTILVTAQPWSPALAGQPARLVVASAPRNEHSPLSRLKSLAYLDNILAAREAAEAGADDALILNTAGRVAGTTIANLFALKGMRLLTPPTGEGCLDGIMRGLLLDGAGALGLAVEEAPLRPEDLFGADAVFATNSVRFLRPVIAIGERVLAQSPLARQILDHLLSITADP
ncbi:aminotransferase class IV [Labrys wisconsinensis]|uniref:Probable branched-chain-amino-acid aminotransferase n=1 Tax=Labrys wisconsinensis TaxID=425677 RepID=A0ABU0JAZ7_9HYPH|nr:aminotransferase class IV [Labrys wisconsinensis]MDQ0471440.1 branched-chain amino acid aminotransferase [Labrys wisconsinensis]